MFSPCSEFYHEFGGSRFFRNVEKCSPLHAVTPRRRRPKVAGLSILEVFALEKDEDEEKIQKGENRMEVKAERTKVESEYKQKKKSMRKR
jgi:hypothetical protein